MLRRVPPSLTPLNTTGSGAVCMTIKVDQSDVLIARVTGICVPHVRLVYTAAVPSISLAGAVIGRLRGHVSLASLHHDYLCDH